MPANRPPDRAPYGSHLPSGIKKLANMAAAKQPDRLSSKQNLANYADQHWQGPKGPEGGAAGVPAKTPKAPKDPNLNPAAMPFPRR
jgi:hypothetical protein